MSVTDLVSETLELWDYRRRVAEIYGSVREGGPGVETWMRWREARDELFANHPQSPIEDRHSFSGLPYFGYDPSWRTVAVFEPAPDEVTVIENSSGGSTGFKRVGSLRFEVPGGAASLDVMWLDAYGGGLFVPFRDETNGDSTYGGGRYLLDTAKGADLGHDDREVILDFNYAYHPSCVHSYKWSCPLAPPANRLSLPVPSGERVDGA